MDDGEENIAFPLRNQGMAKPNAQEHACQYLKQVGLESFSGHKPSQLPDGIRQRSPWQEPSPQNHGYCCWMSPSLRWICKPAKMMLCYLLRVWNDSAATILMITHHLHEALMLADRIALMASSPRGHIAEIRDIKLVVPATRKIRLSVLSSNNSTDPGT